MGMDPRWIEQWRAKGLIRGEAKPAPFGVLACPRGPHAEGIRANGSSRDVAALDRLERIEEAEEPYVAVMIPLRTVNPLNRREHWRARSARTKRERDATALALTGVMKATWEYLSAGCEVRLTRVSPRKVSDEALPAALKAVRDVIGQFLFGGRVGERDDDPRAAWRYGQLQGGPKKHGVIVSVRRRAAGRV